MSEYKDWLSRNLRIEKHKDKGTLIYDNDTNELLSQSQQLDPHPYTLGYPIGITKGGITTLHFHVQPESPELFKEYPIEASRVPNFDEIQRLMSQYDIGKSNTNSISILF